MTSLRSKAIKSLLGLLAIVAADPEIELRAEPEVQRISVLTLNVLADPWKVEKRVPGLMRVLEESDADIIALQEVAPWFADRLMEESWIERYHVPERDGKLQIAREFLILSKHPATRRQVLNLPSSQGRIAFFTTVNIGDSKLTVATCHLDSFLEDGPVRAKQLETIFEALASTPESILLGDFNFGDGEQPDTASPKPRLRGSMATPQATGTWIHVESGAESQSATRFVSRRAKPTP